MAVALLVLETFSKRVALWLGGHTLPIIAIATVLLLWLQVIHDPTPYQLVGVGLYSAFALLVLLIRSARYG